MSMNAANESITEEQCMSFVELGNPFVGWMLFMFIALILLFVCSVFLIIAKNRGWLPAPQVDVLFLAQKSVALFLYFLAMCRNLHEHVSREQILFCNIPASEMVCRNITEEIASNWMKAFIVINMMCLFIAMVVTEYVALKYRTPFEDIKSIACSCTKVWEVAKFILFRQLLWLIPAMFSPGLAILEAVPLSRDCVVDSKIKLLIGHAITHASMILVALLAFIVELFFHLRGKKNNFVATKFILVAFGVGGIVMFFIQIVASLQSLVVVQTYVLTAGFAPLLSLFHFALWLLEWVYIAQFVSVDDVASSLLHAVRPMTYDLRDPQHFQYATESIHDAFRAIRPEVPSLSFDWIDYATPIVQQIQEVATYGLTIDEALAIYAYTSNILYEAINKAFRTYRHAATNLELWQVRKHAYLPYIYLLYSGMSKLPRANQPTLWRGYTRYSDNPVNLEPYTILNQLQPIAGLVSSSRLVAVGDHFAHHPYPFMHIIQTGSVCKGRLIDFISMVPTEQECLFPCDCEFKTMIVVAENESWKLQATIQETDRPDLDYFSIFTEPPFLLWLQQQQQQQLPVPGGNALPVAPPANLPNIPVH